MKKKAEIREQLRDHAANHTQPRHAQLGRFLDAPLLGCSAGFGGRHLPFVPTMGCGLA